MLMVWYAVCGVWCVVCGVLCSVVVGLLNIILIIVERMSPQHFVAYLARPKNKKEAA